jgi:ABC-type antimicrobial peptide transport system permease subunit
MPALSPRKWVVPVGVGASVVGFLLISVSLVSLSNFSGVLVGIGAVMVVGGVAMLASPILAVLTKLSDHVPATSRLVLRDSGRNRTRAAVAVAAIMVILLAPITAMTTAATTAEKDLAFGLPSPNNHMLLTGSSIDSSPQPGPFTDADVAAVAAVVPHDGVAVFDTLDLRVVTGELLDISESDNEQPVAQQVSDGFPVAVGNSELLAVLNSPGVSASIEAGEIVVLGIEDKQTRVSLNGVEYAAHEYPVPVLKWTMPRVLLPESVGTDFADADTRPMVLFVLQQPLTDGEWDEISGLNMRVEGGFGGLSDDTLYLLMAAATFVVVLIVVALVTAVSAAEVDQEIRTIVAVGAPGSIRRRFLGLLTGYQTLIAMALAVPLGLGLVWVFNSAVESVYAGPFGLVNSSSVTVPWVWIIPFAVLLPIVIGLLTWISVRSAPVTPPRRAT